MEFQINGSTWQILELNKETITEWYNEKSNENVDLCFCYTDYERQTIFLNTNTLYVKQRKTLYHELMHVYFYEYCSLNIDIDEEILCDISANAHDLIHEIAERYYSKELE